MTKSVANSSPATILRDARLRRALRMRSVLAAKYQTLMVRSPPKRASRTMQAELIRQPPTSYAIALRRTGSPGQAGGRQRMDMTYRSRGTTCPGFASYRPPKDRGRRECRVQAAPARLACKGKCTLRTPGNNRAAKSTGIPCAMVYGLYVVSSAYRAC